jgi:hypothetical protein
VALAHRRPDGMYRWVANAPRWFYRLGLGWVLGHRMVQLTHRGRKSGQLRRTILEVLHYDPRAHEVLVVSGWEGKTDLFRPFDISSMFESHRPEKGEWIPWSPRGDHCLIVSERSA